jgi:hypothetical protein
MQRSICGIHSTVAAQQRRSTAFATSHPAKHSAANFTVTIRVATYSRATGKQEVIPVASKFPPLHTYPREQGETSGAKPSGNRLLAQVVKKGSCAAAASE